MQGSYRSGSQNGFTLIEVLITVVIISILAGFAMMSYQGYVVRSKRVAAAGCLTQASQYMERFYTVNMRYDQSRAGAAPSLPIAECQRAVANDYTISLTTVSSTAYTLSSQPIGRQAAKDSDCGTLNLNSRGQKTITGSGSVAKCF